MVVSAGVAVLPASEDNPLWRHFSWWLQWDAYREETGREPTDLEAFVAWSQTRQAHALEKAVRTCKSRFPRCGGVILWMGHDCFPCTANTSIVDVRGRLKPAGERVGAVFAAPPDFSAGSHRTSIVQRHPVGRS